MEEKPTKMRSWQVAVVALAILLLPLYVASNGPIVSWGCRNGPEEWQLGPSRAHGAIYGPLYWLCDHSETADDWLCAYQMWCLHNLPTSQARQNLERGGSNFTKPKFLISD